MTYRDLIDGAKALAANGDKPTDAELAELREALAPLLGTTPGSLDFSSADGSQSLPNL
jgi:hypothetical protein